MVARNVARAQITRLAGLDCFVPTELRVAALDELARALAAAPDEIIAVGVIEEWLRTETEWPKPAQIYRLIEQHSEARRLAAPTQRPEPLRGDETDEEIDRRWEQFKRWNGVNH